MLSCAFHLSVGNHICFSRETSYNALQMESVRHFRFLVVIFYVRSCSHHAPQKRSGNQNQYLLFTKVLRGFAGYATSCSNKKGAVDKHTFHHEMVL